mgnify:FL=1
MHSVVETADTGDIENTIELLSSFVLSLGEKDVFHQTL